MAKKKTPEEKTSEFERLIVGKQIQVERAAVDMYSSVINQLAGIAALQNMPKGVFTLSKLPLLENKIDELIKKLNANLEIFVKSGINDAWQLSNNKNDYFADIRLDKSLIPIDRRISFYDPNEPAMKAFQDRVVNGLNLSERIYKTGEIFKSELEAGLGLGISKGQSAAEMGRDLRQYLKDPDLLFRRVRDEEGNLQLSKNAEAFHPGQGVYRSSRANIERLTRTEINQAYRTADNDRWNNMPFVLGQEVHTSGAHPRYDICDEMKGDYPSEFIFIGWHPQCICFAVPKLMSDTQFIQYQKLVLTGEDTPANIRKIAAPIMTIPDSAGKWMNDNKERVAGWKQPPLWWQQNENFVPDLPVIEK
jgi:hypothetical protein